MYNYPVAKCHPQEVEYGNKRLIDEYEWMRDAESLETITFTNEENKFSDQYFEKNKELFAKHLREQQKMSKSVMYKNLIRTCGEITALNLRDDGISQCVLLNNDFTVKKEITSPDFIEGVHVYGILPNPKNKNLCILHVLRDKAERTSGMIYDIYQEKIIAELEDTFSLAWSSCGEYAYYCKANHRENGTIENTLQRYSVKEKADESLYTYQGHAAYGNVFPMDEGGVVVNFAVDYHASATVIYENEKQVIEIPYDGNAREYIGTENGWHFFVTDEDAEMGKIVAVEKGRAFDTKITYIEETEEKISQAGISQGKIICIYEYAGAQRLCVYDEEKNKIEIELPCAYGRIEMESQEMKSDSPLFSYESFSLPPCVLELNLKEYTSTIVYKSGDGCENVVEERTNYISQDGVLLTAYIIHKKDIRKNGKNQTLFYGYGGYNATNYVSSKACGMSISNWIESGGIYVHCIIRGGGEFGEEWHRSGWKGNKKNVFNDFCAILEGVIRDGWTNPSKIAICGLSNGGLLMTALITRRPDLFGCVIASVPQTDLLGFVYDARGTMYITEYGDPREEEMFEYMKSYSPYHNIRNDVSYPGIYIQAGAMDNNVPAYHAKKFTAKMQKLEGKRPVILRVLPYGSHDQGMGEYYHRTIAEMRTFIDIELGLGGKDIE